MKGKIAVITGGGRGIGRATAVLFAKKGAKVIVTSRNGDELKETLREVSKYSEGIAVRGDVRKREDAKRVIKEAVEKFGRVDILVNNAGVAYNENFEEMSDEKIGNTVDTNLHGIFNFTKETIPLMKKQGGGRIINISSGAGKHGIGGLAVYCATKFGVIGFTESMAEEHDDIEFYAVCPGGVNTRMYKDLFGQNAKLNPENVAEKILDTAEGKFRSGSAVDIRG